MPENLPLIKESLGTASKKSMGIAGLLSGGFGFFADVLEPIAPFASYICLVSLIVLIAIICVRVFGILKKEVLPAILFFAFTFVITGLLTLMKNSEEEEEKGVLATMMPALAGIQSSLGLIQKDVTEIKETTTRTEGKVDQVLEGIENVSKLGGIIAHPSSPEEFYKNARTYEQGGDYGNARRAYLEYFKGDTGKLDPHLRFIKFLKVQEGRSGARETYQEVTARLESVLPAYVKILLLDQKQRLPALEKYAESHPDFGPVWYHLSREHSSEKTGSQTMGDRRNELKYTRKFAKVDEAGQLMKYFVDQDLVSEWREDVRQRRNVIESSTELMKSLKNPVKVGWMAHNAGYNGSVSVNEFCKEVLWKIKDTETPYRKINLQTQSDYISQGNIAFTKKQKPCTILITYTDAKDTKNGPFEILFNPRKDGEAAIKKIVQNLPAYGISFVEDGKNARLMMTNILCWRTCLKEIRYGFDEDVADQKFDFPADNSGGASDLRGITRLWVDVPKQSKYVSLQVLYKDGEESPVVRLDR